MNDLSNNSICFKALVSGGWQDYEFEPFREGVEISWLIHGQPGVALLRYAPGARVPRHLHPGLETILVLEGSQSDEQGRYPVGSFVANPQGSEHAVWSEEGCVVLIQWERPVVFVQPTEDKVEQPECR